MIEIEKLHIQDTINYEIFKKLHLKYASEMDETDFARYFLDIDWPAWYKLSTKLRNETVILEREYYSYKELQEIKEKIIKECTFKTTRMINANNMQFLYKKYGDGMSFRTFFREILGMTDNGAYSLKNNTAERTEAFKIKPSQDNEKFREIRERIIKDESQLFDTIQTVDGTTLIELYNKYGGRFSLPMFAEYVMGITERSVKDLRNEGSRITELFKEILPIQIEKIEEIREKIVAEGKLHINAEITKEQFDKLYKKYKVEGLDERTFAIHILKISSDTYVRFNSGIKGTVIVFSNYPINPNYICEIREKVILNEKLHQYEHLTAERFEELYEKYAGILNKELFSKEILDISYETVKTAKRRNTDIVILERIEIPEQYFVELKEKIKRENNLKYNELMSKDRMEEFYHRYGHVVEEKQFYISALGVSKNSMVFWGGVKSAYILTDSKEIDLKKIRKKVIKENNLHYYDEMNYNQVHELHQKYAPTERENVFAREVLDIERQEINRLRLNKGVNITHILLAESLPNIEEIKKLKKQVIKNEKLHKRDKINYERFLELYRKYGGIMPEDMFASQILDIKIQSLFKIKRPNQETAILLDTTMTKEEIKKIREQIISENALYPDKEIDLEYFKNLYYSYDHALPQNEFAFKILDLTKNDLRDLRGEKTKRVKIYNVNREKKIQKTTVSDEEIENLLNDGIEEEKIASILWLPLYMIRPQIEKVQQNIKEKLQQEKEEQEKFFNEYSKLRRRTLRNLEQYIYNPKTTAHVQEYIDATGKIFELGKFDKKDLDILEEAIIFVQAGEKEISLFARICVSYEQYRRANRFILDNIENDKVTRDGRQKLMQIRQEIAKGVNLQKAMEMIKYGETDAKKIAYYTNVPELQIIRMLKTKKTPKTNPIFPKGENR